MTTKRTTIAAVLLAGALTLTACGQVPMPTPTPTLTESATPTATPTATVKPSPTPLPSADSEVLFTISAKLTSPVGATATIVQTVYRPVTELDDLTAIERQLDEECSGWRTSIGEGEYVVSSIEAKDTSTGGKKWPNSGQVVVTMAGSPVFQGEFETFQSFCTSVQVLVPGEVRGVTPIHPGVGADEPGGWATLTYGFGIPTEAGTDATDKRYTQLSGCTITLSAFAKSESTHAGDWTTDRQSAPGLCEVNTPGV
jgi:hypothetical protein